MSPTIWDVFVGFINSNGKAIAVLCSFTLQIILYGILEESAFDVRI